MRAIAAILLASTFAGAVCAQEKSNQLSPLVRLYEPKNMTPARAQQVAEFVTTVLGGSPYMAIRGSGTAPSVQKAASEIRVYWDGVPNAVVIRGGAPAEQDAAETLLKRFDVPEPKTEMAKTLSRMEGRPPASSFEITAYLIRADSGETPAPQNNVPVLMPIPPDLQSAVDEMKQTFSYRSYQLWDQIMTQAGGVVELSGILPLKAINRPSPETYSMSFQRSVVYDDKTISLDGFEFVLKQPWGTDPLQSRIAHTVTLHVGQKLVLGKIRLLPTENADLFLILTAKLK